MPPAPWRRRVVATGGGRPEHLIVATSTGMLLHFTNIAIAELIQAATDNNVAELRRVRGAIGFTRATVSEAHPDGVRGLATSCAEPPALARAPAIGSE